MIGSQIMNWKSAKSNAARRGNSHTLNVLEQNVHKQEHVQ